MTENEIQMALITPKLLRDIARAIYKAGFEDGKHQGNYEVELKRTGFATMSKQVAGFDAVYSNIKDRYGLKEN